ncbi:MAG: hypothetical protein AAFZ74_17875 [Pseudomonadota bacterium]
MVPIEQQDEKLWNRQQIKAGQAILERAIARKRPGLYQIKAAIADCHMTRPSPDWQQMSFLYESLWRFEPTSIVSLNWAVVLAECDFIELANQKLDQLAPELSDFQPWAAAKAHILSKLGKTTEALRYYEMAIAKAPNVPSEAYLKAQVARLTLPEVGSIFDE